MDVVLGVSMAPSTVRMVLLEGDDANGVTVDRDDFAVGGAADRAAGQVLAAILGTRESARGRPPTELDRGDLDRPTAGGVAA